MERTIGKIESLEKKIRNFIANPEQNPELDELELGLDEPDEEELEASRLVGGKFKYRLEDLELDSGKNWLKDLQGDKQQLVSSTRPPRMLLKTETQSCKS